MNKESQKKFKKIEKCRKIVANILIKNKCMDCGNKDPVVLDFDHRNPENKIAEICTLVLKGKKQALLLEIPKCDIVCRNCHRIRTFNQFNQWKVNFVDYITINMKENK